MQTSLDQVVVVPRNGYVNRLQAWASAAILSAQLDVPLRVLWEPQEPAPAAADDLFDPAAVRRSFVQRADVAALATHEDLPRYLTHLPDQRLIVLAGHDRGEQAFMGPLAALLLGLDEPTTLVIIAGGKFHLPTDDDFVRQRCLFYDRIPWHPELDAALAGHLAPHPHYVGLHVRGTDRSREAPPARVIRRGLQALADASDERELFVAADSPESRDRWSDEAAGLGFQPWSPAAIDHDRTRAEAGRDAMLDWRLLGHATALVYPAASSFGEEAAVATGHVTACIPLTASESRQRVRGIGELGRSALTYPTRRGWLRRADGTLPAEET